MYNESKRNIIGCMAWFMAGLLIGVLALVPMVWREHKQSKDGGFPIEKDDIMRYCFCIIFGAGINAALIQWLVGA